uniref:GP-PDE domain-containing protein n=1 Tax=Ciona savignyi TaxID=51511 RepID=H2YUR4_CIOSA
AIAGYAILGTFGGYVLTSILLLNCPTILHKKKKRNFACAHISHRGGVKVPTITCLAFSSIFCFVLGAAERTENTLTAFHHAVKTGTQLLELDVHLTKDKKVVVAHDADLTRVTGVDAKISEYDYEDLPPLLDDLGVTFCPSETYHNDGPEERIPLLDKIFEEFPNIPINIDVKAQDDELIMKTFDLVKQYKREKLTIWGNFKDENCQKLYKLDPSIPLLFSMRRVFLLYVWFYTGLLPFIPLKESYFEIAYPGMLKKMKLKSLSPTVNRLLVLVEFFLRSKILISHLKARGIPVGFIFMFSSNLQTYFWVLNDEEDFKGAFELGAEGVMTDHPTKLKIWLD